MIGIVFATQREAEPFLELSRARFVSHDPCDAYEFTLSEGHVQGIAVISGMGSAAAARGTGHLILEHAATEVISAGVCGALGDEIAIGDVFQASEIRAYEPDVDREAAPVHRCVTDRWPELRVARLVSVEQTVCSPSQRAIVAAWGELVDMEGAAVARTCREHGVEVRMIKGVTDLADETARETIQQNLREVSEKVAAALVDSVLRSRQIAAAGGAAGSTASPTEAETSRRGHVKPSWSVRKLMDFVRVEHTIFSLPLLFAGAWLGAGGQVPSLRILALVMLAGLGARTLGMAMNRILDRDLDARNPRTAQRELPSGRLSTASAFSVAGIGLALYVLACALLGGWCLILSPVPALLLVGYSLLKRFTILCHFGIGLCLAAAPLCAFVAASDRLDFNAPVVLLSIFAFFWISGFDVIYAIMDLASDRMTGVRSLPARMGSSGAQAAAAVIHTAALAAAAALVIAIGGGRWAWAAFGVTMLAMALAQVPWISIERRFFPLSAVAGVSGAMLPFLGSPS